MAPVTLAAPAGPLCWLHPEFARLEERGASEVTLDALPRLALELANSRTLRIVVPPGPRGQALAAVLRPHALEPWTALPRIAPEPAPSSLEAALLGGLAEFEGESFELARNGDGYARRRLPLTRANAASRLATGATSVWVLPVVRKDGAHGLLPREHASLVAEPGPFARAGLVPFFHPLPRHAAPTWFGVLPAPDPNDPLARSQRAVLAALHPERVLEGESFASLAASGADLYAMALASLLPDTSSAVPKPRAAIVGICGIDGSGKSSHARALAEALSARGLRVRVHKVYRHGVFHETVTALTRRTQDPEQIHLWRTERIAKAFDSLKCFTSTVAPDLDTHDVLIFDRYVQTHHAAGAGRCHWDPFTRALLRPFPAADAMFLIDVPVETALARIGERSQRTVDENPYMLTRFRELLLRLAAGSMTVLAGSEPFATNHARIVAEVDLMLARRVSRGAGA